MLIVCKSLPEIAGLVTDSTKYSLTTIGAFFPVTIGNIYRPLALSFRGGANGNVQTHVLIKADHVDGSNISIYYEDINLFSIVDHSIDDGWTILHQTDHTVQMGVLIAKDIEKTHDLLCVGDLEMTAQILHWSKNEKIGN